MLAPPRHAALRVLRVAVMPVAYLLFTLALWWRLWTPIDDARWTWKYDPRHTYWGDQIFAHESLADGHFALWNPYDRAGSPVYVEPDPGMLYPANWIFTGWGFFAGEVPYVAITIKILLHWVFGAIGMHLFLRRLRMPEPACYAGGVIFGYACPAIRYGGSTLNWSFAWIPWVLLALHWFSERPSPRRGVVLGTSAAMLLLSGSPTVLLYMLVIAIPYGLYVLHGRLRASLLALLVAAGAFALWVAPLVVSNAQHLSESVRVTRDFSFITDSVFSTATFLSFLVPNLGGENIYYGLLPLLCIGALVASSGRTRALVFLGVAAFGVALALGNHAGVLPSLASSVSPFSLFRRAHRYLYITTAAVAVLAGLGFGYVLGLSDPERKRAVANKVLWVGGGIALVLFAAYAVSVATTERYWAPKNESFGHAAVAAALGTWLCRAVLLTTGRRQTVYAWIAVAALALDMWTANAKVIEMGFSPPTKLRNDALVERLADLRTEWRIYDRGYLGLRPGTRLKIRDFGGYEDYPINLSRYEMLLRASQRNLRLLGHANVRYYLDGGRRPPVRPRPADNFAVIEPNVYEVPAVAPAVMYVPSPVSVKDANEALRALGAITPGEGAVVEGPPPPQGPAGASIVAGRLTRLEPNRVIAEIETPGPGLVVIAEAYYPVWTATLNGDPVEMQPANVLFRGIPVPAAGLHRIEMRLRPLHFWGLFPGFLAAFGLLAWAVWPRRRRPDPEPCPPR